MKRLVILLPLLAISAAFAKDPRVVYHKADDALNQKASEKLIELFDPSKGPGVSGDLFEPFLFCPAGLWEQLMKEPAVVPLKKGVMGGRIPKVKDGKVIRMVEREGKVFQGKEEVEAFWKAFGSAIKISGKPVVRKLTEQEIDIVWTMIPFPIDEPAFIIEWKEHKILVFMTKALKIAYIDELQVYIDGNIRKK